MSRKLPLQILLREYFEGILAALFLALFLRFFIVSILYVPSPTMEPNLKQGDFIVGLRISYGFPLPLTKGERLNQKKPQRGDLVSFRFPADEDQILIRRIVGLPGEKVEIKEGQVLINGKPLSSEQDLSHSSGENRQGTYGVFSDPQQNTKAIRVSKDHYFVLSDSRVVGDDSSVWGLVPLKNIESRVVLIWLSVDSQQEAISLRWDRLFKILPRVSLGAG